MRSFFRLSFILFIGALSYTPTVAQSIGISPSITNFNIPLQSGMYTGYTPVGSIPGVDWHHLFATRHGNPDNNYQLQIASSLWQDDRLYFRKLSDGGLGAPNIAWIELATRGSNFFSGNQDVEGTLRWGTNPDPTWGEGLLSMNSGWGTGSYATIGSTAGSSGSLIMLHNPHVPFRADNAAPGYTGRSGLRLASDGSVSSSWDVGLAGDFFHIYRHNVGEFFRITNQGNVGIGTNSPQASIHTKGGIRIENYSGISNQYYNHEIRAIQGGFGFWFGESSSENANIALTKSPLSIHGGGISFSNGALLITAQPSVNGNSGTMASFRPDEGTIYLASKNFKLKENGYLYARQIEVQATGNFPDYVFDDDYELRSVEEVESYIKENHHLPDVPSASEIEEKGHNLGEMDEILLRKVEELTLYIIELKKQNDLLAEKVEALENSQKK